MSGIHATSVYLNKKGILIIGKSDLVFRLIEQQKAILIADDVTDLKIKNKKIYASCPASIKGKIEIRGIGIISKPYKENKKIDLVVELVDSFKKVERLPEIQFWEYEKIRVKKIKIYPFEPSASYKVRLACDEKA